jgi:hypothetical protein
MEAVRGDGRWCVVTGGRGFAARHLVTMLLRSGEWRVRVADLGPAITLDRDEEEGFLGAALREGQAVYVSADLRDKAQVARGAWSPICPPSHVVSQVGIIRRRGGALSFRVCVGGDLKIPSIGGSGCVGVHSWGLLKKSDELVMLDIRDT